MWSIVCSAVPQGHVGSFMILKRCKYDFVYVPLVWLLNFVWGLFSYWVCLLRLRNILLLCFLWLFVSISFAIPSHFLLLSLSSIRFLGFYCTLLLMTRMWCVCMCVCGVCVYVSVYVCVVCVCVWCVYVCVYVCVVCVCVCVCVCMCVCVVCVWLGGCKEPKRFTDI